MSGVNQPIQPGTAPPPIPTVAYHVAINGQAAGPFGMATLKQMAQTGQFVSSSLVWKAGMSGWVQAGSIDERRVIETVSELIAGFEAENPGITVQVEYLSYSDGDSLVAESIQNGTTPNLILEGPARLAAAWGGTYPYAGHSYYTWKAKLPPIPPKGHGSFAALVLFPVLQSV